MAIIAIFKITKAPVKTLLFCVFLLYYPSRTIHFPSYTIARAILIHLDNNILKGQNISKVSINQLQRLSKDLSVV